MPRFGALEAGGTKMVCAAGDEYGRVTAECQFPTETPETTLPQILAFFQEQGIEALGIGCFGPVDLRKDSPTFGKWLGFELSEENKDELLIPGYCGHGYLVLEPSIVSYKCAEKFYGEYDDGILWDDPDIGVQWPLEEIGGRENVILAEKDQKLQRFKEFVQQYGGLPTT